MAEFRMNRSDAFYFSALCYAQSLLSEGKPAQALLQVNKSFLADLSDPSVLQKWPPAYEAVVWIIKSYAEGEGEFLGNPVRHYQHLATRMSGPRAEVRTLRAWSCFYLAEKCALGFSRDLEQIETEKILIPSLEEIVAGIEERGWLGEGNVLRGTLKSIG